jgi:hypothetical protein
MVARCGGGCAGGAGARPSPRGDGRGDGKTIAAPVNSSERLIMNPSGATNEP